MKVTAVDLFCGAGGLTCGLERAGINVVAGFDNDVRCEHAYEQNTDSTFVHTDIHAIAQNPERVKRLYPWDSDVTILAACAPCQPFSALGRKANSKSDNHEKWRLLREVGQIVEYVQPDVVITENVLQVRSHRIYDKFVDGLRSHGFVLNSDANKKVYCPEYGIPQKRKRWVLLASKIGRIELPKPAYREKGEFPTVKDAIDHLPPIQAGEKHPDYELHRSRSLSDTNLERIRNMEPGRDWRLWEERGLDHLLADCHKKESGRSYKAPYSRMSPDEPAPTITTQFYNYGSGRFGHYDMRQDRALSLLEGALLQTFPVDYDFYAQWDDVGVNNLGRLIGNAVPPRLAEIIGEQIVEQVSARGEMPTKSSGSGVGT